MSEQWRESDNGNHKGEGGGHNSGQNNQNSYHTITFFLRKSDFHG